MKLAFFSPLNPQKSGISDYSEELLPHLASKAEIDLFLDGFRPASHDISARFRCFDYRSRPETLARLGEYDAVIYHMGNDHRYHTGIYEVAQAHPGIIVFHDFALQDFFLGLARARDNARIYLDEVGACHGELARAEAEEALARGGVPPAVASPLSLPLNARLARAAEAIIVHSGWSRARFEKIAPATPVRRIHMPVRPDARGHHLPASAGETDGPLQLASFGLITPGKGIEPALRALAALRSHVRAFHYTLVGEPNPFFDVREIIRAYGLTDRVTITGHVSLEEFERRIAATDLALNMRERTVGETSASLCRIMAAGVPAIVSNVGWFAELPDDSVVKIDADEYSDGLLYAYLQRLIEDAPLRAAIGANARRYVLQAHAIEQSADDYISFIRETIAQRTRGRFINTVAVEIARLGIMPGEDDPLLRDMAREIAAVAPTGAVADGNGASQLAEEKIPADAVAATTTADTTETIAAGAAPCPAAPPGAAITSPANGRLRKIEGIDYKRAAIEYPQKLDAERYHYLLTKPFYNLANKPPKHRGEGMDVETHRHFCDFANLAVALGLPAGRRLLDVGCGSGWLSEYFARLGYDVTGIDISSDLIRIARDRTASVAYDVDHETRLRCRFATHDIERAPLDETFDAILCYDSLHHFEDEQAVVRHLSAMLRMGGLLFILEGDKPPEGSPTEAELIGVMAQYETLESPFSRGYLRELLSDHGFAVVGDYVSVNGLFERDTVEDGGLLRIEPPATNYLLCKKVAHHLSAASVPDSRRPGILSARFVAHDRPPRSVSPGAPLEFSLAVENTGDTLWLVGQIPREGVITLGLRVFDEAGECIDEFHGQPPLPGAVAPGESVLLKIEYEAPAVPGAYRLKFDLVDQFICWFEERGSEPLVLPFTVE